MATLIPQGQGVLSIASFSVEPGECRKRVYRFLKILLATIVNAFGGNISRELVQGTCHPAYSGSATAIVAKKDPPRPHADAVFDITRVDATKVFTTETLL